MHRDLKLDNILVHFPKRDNIKKITNEDIKQMDLITEKVIVKIADLGFAREIVDNSQKNLKRFTYVGSPLLMPPEQLKTRWNKNASEGYDYKIDVWALGGIFYQMLTGMFVFVPDDQSTYDGALRNLNNMVQEGTWQWPTGIEISVDGFELLTTLLQFDPAKRPSWTELHVHKYFREYNHKKMIPLVIDTTTAPPEGIKFEDGKIFLNTKDPNIADKMEQALMKDVKNKEELDDLTTLFMNHRLKMAADIDLFDELERNIDEENLILEGKSENLNKMSQTMRQLSNRESLHEKVRAETMIGEFFEGFYEKGPITAQNANAAMTTRNTTKR